MYPTKSWREKLKLLSVIMWPILVTQIGMYAMNFIDTVMSGRAGAEDLAGVAIGSSLWIPVLTGITGVLLALTPILSHKLGAEDKEGVPFYVQQGIYVAVFLTIIVFGAGAFLVGPILSLMDLEPQVRFIAFHYLIGLAAGMIPLFVYTVIRGFIDSLGQTRVTMIITLAALPVNAFFNYVLIFGRAGFPELGGIGAGYATSITYWFILFLCIYITHKNRPFSYHRLYRAWRWPAVGIWKEILLLGLPIGLTIFFETSIFSAVTLLLSVFSTEVIAAHQAAINFASLLYMVPLSFAFALTITVGYEVGGRRHEDAVSYAKIGLLLSVGMGLAACVIIYALRVPVSYLYTSDPDVAGLIQAFLIYSIFFQLSDAVNTPIQGILRGYKDVNVPFVMAFVSFWLIGLPFGWALATWTELGPFGYWIGLITALAVCATFLAVRLRWMQKREWQLPSEVREEEQNMLG